MKVEPIKNTALLFLALATLFLSACGPSPEAREAAAQQAIAQGIQEANQNLDAGNVDAALARLEALEASYPNRPAIIEALAFAYARKADHPLAAFYFDTVFRLDPERSEMALYAARAHSESQDWDAAATAYQAYLSDNPRDDAAWRALARTETSANRHKPALDAWLESIRHSPTPPNAEDALAVGRLYLAVDNPTQARRWFTNTLEAQPPERIRAQALLGLLQIDLQEKQWADAEKRLAALDKAGPGVLDASPLAPARAELTQWREAQEELEKERLAAIARAEEERKRVEEAARLADAEARRKQQAGTITIDRTGQTVPPRTDETSDNGEDTTQAPAQLADATPPPPPPEPTLAQRAQAAYDAGDYAEAITLYQNALADDPTAAPLYQGLSRAYFAQQSWPQAELYAAEAMRLQPDNLSYTLNYLRSIQRTQPRERLMDEMIRAKQRFPDSPDITLALARGYERIMNNRRNALFLYQEFLTIAPGHPQAEDIRTHIQTLR